MPPRMNIDGLNTEQLLFECAVQIGQSTLRHSKRVARLEVPHNT